VLVRQALAHQTDFHPELGQRASSGPALLEPELPVLQPQTDRQQLGQVWPEPGLQVRVLPVLEQWPQMGHRLQGPEPLASLLEQLVSQVQGSLGLHQTDHPPQVPEWLESQGPRQTDRSPEPWLVLVSQASRSQACPSRRTDRWPDAAKEHQGLDPVSWASPRPECLHQRVRQTDQPRRELGCRRQGLDRGQRPELAWLAESPGQHQTDHRQRALGWPEPELLEQELPEQALRVPPQTDHQRPGQLAWPELGWQVPQLPEHQMDPLPPGLLEPALLERLVLLLEPRRMDRLLQERLALPVLELQAFQQREQESQEHQMDQLLLGQPE